MKTATQMTAASLVGTIAVCVAVLIAFVGALCALTDGLETWTFEDRRRLEARRGLLAAPATTVRTSEGGRRSLWGPADEIHDITLVNFVYTTCPTVCRTLGSDYLQMQRALDSRSPTRHAVRLLSLSFDLEHDGPGQLFAYARRNRADAGVWTIAVPESRAASAQLLHDLGVVVVHDGSGGYVHNGSIHLLDASGKVLAIFDERDWRKALAMALRVSRDAP